MQHNNFVRARDLLKNVLRSKLCSDMQLYLYRMNVSKNQRATTENVLFPRYIYVGKAIYTRAQTITECHVKRLIPVNVCYM